VLALDAVSYRSSFATAADVSSTGRGHHRGPHAAPMTIFWQSVAISLET
jgi:hypothetical protein